MGNKFQGKDGMKVEALYKCPCCDEKVMKKMFVKFTDPCICGSGKTFKDCCYKTLPQKNSEISQRR